MTHEQLVDEYLAALAGGSTERVLALFSPSGQVDSPLYGTLPATEFYPALFADTEESRLTLRTTMEGTLGGLPVVSFWFDFDWTLANGEPAPFTVVDVAELDVEGLITTLHIVYDTAPVQAAFERQHSA